MASSSQAAVERTGAGTVSRRRFWHLRVRKSAVPGLGLSLGYTLTYLALIVLIPLTAVILKGTQGGWAQFLRIVSSPRVVASYRVTIGASLFAALVSSASGMLVAWVLARYRFPGRRFVDALVDLPFALPTAVAGISLTSLYAGNGLIGRYLEPHGIHIAFTPAGIALAMCFVGFPFVVRSIQPVLEDLDAAMEEAAASLGAGAWQRFRRVILPTVFPALLTGTALAFARGVGEYGSVIFIGGNMPMRTEITSLLIVTKLEEYDYTGATAIACAMLGMSFAIMLLVNLLQWRMQRQEGTRS